MTDKEKVAENAPPVIPPGEAGAQPDPPAIETGADTLVIEAPEDLPPELINGKSDIDEIPEPDGDRILPDPLPGLHTRKTEDYRGLDWSRSNSELAKLTGKTRQYMSILRKKFFPVGLPDDYEPPVTASPEQIQPSQNFRGISEMTFDMGIGTLATVFGDEWKPRTPEERETVVATLEKYFATKNLPDIPPGWMVIIVIGLYSAPRLKAPQTASKIKLGWVWAKDKMAGLFRRKQKRAAITAVPD